MSVHLLLRSGLKKGGKIGVFSYSIVKTLIGLTAYFPGGAGSNQTATKSNGPGGMLIGTVATTLKAPAGLAVRVVASFQGPV